MTKDLYILTLWQGVEPILTGPYKDAQTREITLQFLTKEYGPESSYFPVDVTAGSQIEIGIFKYGQQDETFNSRNQTEITSTWLTSREFRPNCHC